MKKRTTIYVLLNLVIILVGIVLILITPQPVIMAIGTSILAGGLATLAFGLIRHFDELENSRRHNQISGELEELEKAVRSLRIQEMARSRIRTRHPREEIKNAIEAISRKYTIEIDIMGVSLRPFYEDLMDLLLERTRLKARLLLMDPRTNVFKVFCDEQGRDQRRLIQDIHFTTTKALKRESPKDDLRVSRQTTNREISGPITQHVELRWDPGFQSVTLARINDIVFVRSRLVNEAASPDAFFEVYRDNDPEIQTYRKYFNQLWDRSAVPGDSDINEIGGNHSKQLKGSS